MCYYNSCKIPGDGWIRLNNIGKETRNYRLNRPAQSGFDYREWPVIKTVKAEGDFEIKEIHWEYIPATVYDEFDLRDLRIMVNLLNAKGGYLLKNEKGQSSRFREGARNGRCLAISSGFYEWRHVPKTGKKGQPLAQTEKIPYYITLKSQPGYFFMAAISRTWTNQRRDQSADTFAIVTTGANELMQKVNNSQLRMPVIMPDDIAWRWLKAELSDPEITELANYRYDTNEMVAWPVAKDFLTKEIPWEEQFYENLPPVY